jgi:RNA polymerase sigma-70 factor (ECF subfamily)
MDSKQAKEREFENLLNRFADYIQIHIHKFNLYKYGLDPDDVSQEVRLKIWKLFYNEKTIVNYSSYIKKIVNSSVIDHLRKIKREEEIFSHERHIAENELTYNLEISRYKSLEEIVGTAVESLIESRRQVVKLYLMNLSIREIADYLNWSANKTRNLLYRGLKDLKKALQDMDIDYATQE